MTSATDSSSNGALVPTETRLGVLRPRRPNPAHNDAAHPTAFGRHPGGSSHALTGNDRRPDPATREWLSAC